MVAMGLFVVAGGVGVLAPARVAARSAASTPLETVCPVIKGFRDFIFKGDLISAAVGLVMALATFALIQAIAGGLITPVIGAILGEQSFYALSFTINGSEFAYGAVIEAAIVFVVTALAVYFLIVVPSKAYQDRRWVSADTRPCPECTSAIAVAAKRCPHCTSVVTPANA
jgi:large conductance mechanosensitive channel